MSTEIVGEKTARARGRMEINPNNPVAEWRRQSSLLANRYAERLGFPNKKAYTDTLPGFGPRPKSFEGLSIPAVPVLVDPRVDLSALLDIAEISSFFDLQKLEDWLVEGGFGIPKDPYATWLTYIPNQSVVDTRVDLLKYDDRRGGTPVDGISLYLRDRHILNEIFLSFPGSQIGPDNVPFLFASPNPEKTSPPSNAALSYGAIESSSPKFACLIASKT